MLKQRQSLCISLWIFDDGLPPSLCHFENLNNAKFKAHHYVNSFMN